MARRWTIEEECEKREELMKFYVNQNKTISEIGKILKISESTVFDRMKRLNVSITPEKKLHYLNKKVLATLPNFSEKLAEFFGIMLGDGHITSGQIWIYVNTTTDKKYVPYVKDLLGSLFKISVGCYHRKNDNMVDLFISSVDLMRYLNKKGLFVTNKVSDQVKVPSWIFDKDSYKKSFLRGFFDTDGSIYKLKFGVQMSFCNRSFPLLQSVREILWDLGYRSSHISSDKVYLTRKSDLHRYIQEIGFGNSKHFKRAIKFGIVE